jgi:phenylacetate-CoA ligase
VRAAIQNGFGAKVYDQLGGAHGVMCCSCDAEPYAGMHVLGEDTAVTTQLVDQETKAAVPLVDGAIGERVKTSLWWEAQPQLRASVGDVYQVHVGTCSCGVEGPRIRVLGRTDDLLIVKGVKIYPAAVKNVVQELVPLASGAFRIVLDAPPPRVEPPLRLTVERGEGVDEAGAEELTRRLEQVLHQRLTVRPEITIVAAGTLERTPLKEKLIERRY